MATTPFVIPPNILNLYNICQAGNTLNQSPLTSINSIISDLNVALTALEAAALIDPTLAPIVTELQTVLSGPLASIQSHLTTQFSSFTRNLAVYSAQADLNQSLGTGTPESAIAAIPSMFGSILGGISSEITQLENAISSGNIVSTITDIINIAGQIYGITSSEQSVYNGMISQLSNFKDANRYAEFMNDPVLSQVISGVAVGSLLSTQQQAIQTNLNNLGFATPVSLNTPVSSDSTPYQGNGIEIDLDLKRPEKVSKPNRRIYKK